MVFERIISLSLVSPIKYLWLMSLNCLWQIIAVFSNIITIDNNWYIAFYIFSEIFRLRGTITVTERGLTSVFIFFFVACTPLYSCHRKIYLFNELLIPMYLYFLFFKPLNFFLIFKRNIYFLDFKIVKKNQSWVLNFYCQV